jgi:hypothetical protein
MRPPHICVAGLDVTTHDHIRPVLHKAQLDTALLAANGGPFALGAIVDLGPLVDVSSPPEVEDRRFDRDTAKRTTQLTGAAFWKEIDAAADDDLNEIFGEQFEETSRSFSTPEGEGSHSLGCYRPSQTPNIGMDTYGTKVSVYAYMPWGNQVKKIPITDLRLVDANFTVSPARVQSLQKLVSAASDVLFSVGLSRPFAKSGSDEKRHWMQINNVFPKQNPLWT